MLSSKSREVSSLPQERDPERQLKLKECCDLLLAAGYFRARLATLSPFDKVVGGLVWCITASGIDVDVEILYKESYSLGERIHLSDQIIAALVQMKCPKLLQPQEIQGLNYNQLFPVIQWLIRHVIETRRLMGDSIRAQSVQQFKKTYSLAEEEFSDANTLYLKKIMKNYRPTRIFKQKPGAKFDSEGISTRTEATLLEYGEKMFGSSSVSMGDEEKEEGRGGKSGKQRNSLIGKFDPSQSKEAEAAKAAKEAEERRKAEEKELERLKALESQMAASEETVRLSGASVGSLVGMKSDELKAAQERYEEEKKRLEAEAEAERATLGGGRKGMEAAFQRQSEALKKKIAAARSVLESKEDSVKGLESKAAEASAALEKKRAYIDRIEREMLKLEEIESNSANKEALVKLRQLVYLNEQLKQQESVFKSTCMTQRKEIMDEIKRLESVGDNDPESQRMNEIESIYESDLAKLHRIRQVLAKKNQEYAKLSRQMDEYPTRAELIQYERRFVELYELVAAKLAETKKYYSMYNSLSESHGYMNSEQGLLTSIISNFPVVMKQKNGSAAFLESMEKAVAGVKQQQNHVQQQLTGEGVKKENLMAAYNGLMEKQRAYFKAVKEFQEECQKNEKLLEMAEAAGMAQEE